MLARPDLAEQGLEGLVRSRSYRPLSAMHGALPVVDITRTVDPQSDRINQLLFGEAFDVLDREGDRVWGRARRDGTVGWINRWALVSGAPLATHRVASVSAVLPLNALVHHEFSGVAAEDLKPVGDLDTDPVAIAEALLGTPHALGARSSRTTDCSGLVQQALYACGRAGPRHSDQQAGLGEAIARSELA
ncbi:MAG: peptidoglycan endopeptidase, partial [Caulobacteraceae bacterium]